MVYDMPDADLQELVEAKVESQFARALRYVQAVEAERGGALGRPAVLPRP